jgi:hypothetical protein
MKKTFFSRGSCFILFFLVAVLAAFGAQAQQAPPQTIGKTIAKTPPLNPPTITSINEYFQSMAVQLVLHGTHFPSKYAPNNVARLIRLVTIGGSGEFYIGQTGDWTPTVLADVFGYSVPTGRRYRIGIVEFQETPAGINNKRLLSNELEFLVLMNLDHVTPSYVLTGGVIVEVATANQLGPKGAKIVKCGNQTATITDWPESGGIFKVRLPQQLAKGTYDLFVEENGTVVSMKLPIMVTGGK